MKEIIFSWTGGIAIACIVFGALHITSVQGASEEERAEAHRVETLRAAKLKARNERRIAEAKAIEQANRMMSPIAQATVSLSQ
ncbi:MAG: hypothetical protein H6R01_465 [Burkholderiaceae bacterium]|nr:hypothetical protein [Burkholderiaceae bacterium]